MFSGPPDESSDESKSDSQSGEEKRDSKVRCILVSVRYILCYLFVKSSTNEVLRSL